MFVRKIELFVPFIIQCPTNIFMAKKKLFKFKARNHIRNPCRNRPFVICFWSSCRTRLPFRPRLGLVLSYVLLVFMVGGVAPLHSEPNPFSPLTSIGAFYYRFVIRITIIWATEGSVVLEMLIFSILWTEKN